MSDAGAEYNCAFFADIFHISIHYQRVAFRNVYFAFKVADIVLHTVETYLSEVDVGMYSYTSHGDKFSDFNSGLDIQLVGSIAKNLKYVLIVCTFRCCGKSEGKFRLEI